jgi:hypothetical protein
MAYVVDHVFVMCSVGAPEAEGLVRAGLLEGASNTHPGQGTASRRFFFDGVYLELVWVSDADEARREPARSTRLWERWAKRDAGACPFGLVFRDAAGSAAPPFPTWSYEPAYSPVAIDIAKATPLREPELFYFRFPRPPGALSSQPTAHALPLRKLTALRVGIPGTAPRSEGVRAAEATGLVTFLAADAYLMTLGFDGETQGRSSDLRPDLAIVLGW